MIVKCFSNYSQSGLLVIHLQVQGVQQLGSQFYVLYKTKGIPVRITCDTLASTGCPATRFTIQYLIMEYINRSVTLNPLFIIYLETMENYIQANRWANRHGIYMQLVSGISISYKQPNFYTAFIPAEEYNLFILNSNIYFSYQGPIFYCNKKSRYLLLDNTRCHRSKMFSLGAH